MFYTYGDPAIGTTPGGGCCASRVRDARSARGGESGGMRRLARLAWVGRQAGSKGWMLLSLPAHWHASPESRQDL